MYIKFFTILFVSFCSLSSIRVYSQNDYIRNMPAHDLQPVRFGFSLGVNTMNFRVAASEFAVSNNYFGEVSSLTPGFNINIISNLRLHHNIDLRILPGVSFGQRTIDYYNTQQSGIPGSENYLAGSYPIIDGSQELESSFIELPFLIKYKSDRIRNYRPYLIGGFNLRYDLAKNYNEAEGVYLSLKPFNIYAEAGFGVDFYMSFIKFGTEIRYSFGLLDVLQVREASGQPKYQESIKRLSASMISVVFNFE